MKVAFLADSHFDESGRLDECVRLHRWIAEDAASRGCRGVLHGGDLYERRSTPREREAVAQWLELVRELDMEFVGVRGNHDAPGDVEYLRHLEGDTVALEAPDVVLPSWDRNLVIACLPWPSRAGILARAESREDGEQTIQAALRNVLRGLGERARDGKSTVLFLGHCMVRDSRTSTGQPLVGCDVEVGLEDLALVGADAYLLGHIHMHQQWEIDGSPCIYPGSPRRTAFGEREAKGYVVLDLEPGRPVQWEFVESPATPMVDITGEWLEFGDTWEMGLRENLASVEGAELRFRYTVASEHREAAKLAARKLADQWGLEGAVLVKVEEQVTATTRARAPEVATAPTVPDKLRALWKARGEEVARADLLLSLAVALEEEVRHAS